MNSVATEKHEYSWSKVLIWAFLFYLVWNWKTIGLVYSQGVLPGPDDFLRLSQTNNWLLGQSWFDLTAYRMFPPVGGDIHWSRFADAPIGILISFFDLFTDFKTAGRLAAIAWPLSLFMATLATMIALCDRLAGKGQRLLVLLFFVMSMTTLAEFRPGRIDHHNIQILILALMMLGLVGGLGRISNYVIGVLTSFSVVIGLDLLLIILALMVFFVLEWCFQAEASRQRLLQIAIGTSVSALFFYVSSFPMEIWFNNQACDAFSLVYLTALILLSATFIALSCLSDFRSLSTKFVWLKRMLVSGSLGITSILVLLSLFPACLDGPLGVISPELQSRWLDQVVEAKGLLERLKLDPAAWVPQTVYLFIMLCVMGVVLFRQAKSRPALMIIGFIVLTAILGAFYQTRILRTGLYAVIPFCVIFMGLSWQWLNGRNAFGQYVSSGIQAVICILLTSAFWFAVGVIIKPEATNQKLIAEVQTQSEQTATQAENASFACTSEPGQRELKAKAQGHVIADLNTATSILVHTNHTIEGSSYHRNGESILNVISFFEGSADESLQIAKSRKADYIAICRTDGLQTVASNNRSVARLVEQNKLPEWLEWVSSPDAQLMVLRVVR